MKKYICTLLALVIVAQSFVQAGLVLYYHINKAYIAQQLCENRKDPSKNCNGHCYLSKQLKHAEEQEQKQSQSVVKEKEELFSSIHSHTRVNYSPAFTVTSFPLANHGHILPGHVAATVKPPAA